MTISILSIIIFISFLALVCSRPSSNSLNYTDLESMGTSCPERDRCSGYHNNLTYVDRSCECDRLCVYYDDCCVDAPSRTNSWRRVARNNMICLNYGGMPHTGVYVVSTCSRNWYGSDEIRQKCTGDLDWSDPLTAIPATDVAQAVTYRNLFCAECNNANMRSLRNFNIRMACEGLPVDDQPTQDQIFADITYNEEFHSWGLYRLNSYENQTVYYGCEMIFDVPGYLNNSVRFCRSDIISTCPPNYNRPHVSNRCREYMAVVYDNLNAYKNPHCALCNTNAPVSCTTQLISRKRPMSFALLLDVNQSDGDQVGMRRVATPECPSDHKYDPYFKRCRQLVCALPGHVVVNGRCVRG